MEFTPPEGMRIPDGTEEGDTFESMTTYELCKGGKVRPVAIEGQPIKGSEKKKGFVEHYDEAMKGTPENG